MREPLGVQDAAYRGGGCGGGCLGSGLGRARLGSVRLSRARLDSVRLTSARLARARLGSARTISARLRSVRLRSAIARASLGRSLFLVHVGVHDAVEGEDRARLARDARVHVVLEVKGAHDQRAAAGHAHDGRQHAAAVVHAVVDDGLGEQPEASPHAPALVEALGAGGGPAALEQLDGARLEDAAAGEQRRQLDERQLHAANDQQVRQHEHRARLRQHRVVQRVEQHAFEPEARQRGAQHAAGEHRERRVGQVAHRDLAVVEAVGLLGAHEHHLLVDDARDGRVAHQQAHDQEQRRHGDAQVPDGVRGLGDAAHAGVAARARHRPAHLRDAVHALLGALELGGAGLEALGGLGELAAPLVQLGLAGLDLGLAAGDLRAALAGLRLAGRDLGIERRARGVELGLRRRDGTLQRRDLGVEGHDLVLEGLGGLLVLGGLLLELRLAGLHLREVEVAGMQALVVVAAVRHVAHGDGGDGALVLLVEGGRALLQLGRGPLGRLVELAACIGQRDLVAGLVNLARLQLGVKANLGRIKRGQGGVDGGHVGLGGNRLLVGRPVGRERRGVLHLLGRELGGRLVMQGLGLGDLGLGLGDERGVGARLRGEQLGRGLELCLGALELAYALADLVLRGVELVGAVGDLLARGLELGRGVVDLGLRLGHDGLRALGRARAAGLLHGLGDLVGAGEILVGVVAVGAQLVAADLGHVVAVVDVGEVEGLLGNEEQAADVAALVVHAERALGVEQARAVVDDCRDGVGVGLEVGHAVGGGGGRVTGRVARRRVARRRVARRRGALVPIMRKRDGVADGKVVALGVDLVHRGLAHLARQLALHHRERVNLAGKRTQGNHRGHTVIVEALVAHVAALDLAHAVDLADCRDVIGREAVGEGDLEVVQTHLEVARVGGALVCGRGPAHAAVQRHAQAHEQQDGEERNGRRAHVSEQLCDLRPLHAATRRARWRARGGG